MALELTTVADDEIVAHDGARVVRRAGLEPDCDHQVEGLTVRTLPRPPGERLATITTVNDVHFGEVECGRLGTLDIGPVLSSGPGEPPYPEVTNAAAVAEMAALEPDAVVVKGDLTAVGSVAQYERFLSFYEPVFGPRLHVTRGNHDVMADGDFASDACQEVTLPGVTLAVLDTSVGRKASGRLGADQLAWLDDLAVRAAADDRPVLVFGHHHVWDPSSRTRAPDYFGINPDDSEQLVALVARRAAVVGYFAGHTHRNRVRRFAATGSVPWVEVACVKDFPGAWVEYRVHEGGILQVQHRISGSEALAWTERTRALFAGLYPQYSFGRLEDRCFPIGLHRFVDKFGDE